MEFLHKVLKNDTVKFLGLLLLVILLVVVVKKVVMKESFDIFPAEVSDSLDAGDAKDQIAQLEKSIDDMKNKPAVVEPSEELLQGAPLPSLANFASEVDLQPSDLLPKDPAASAFDDANPSGVGDVSQKNFLTSDIHMGINTVSSSMKNANLQLRSDPYIPKKDLGPFNNSTILASDHLNRRPFEIG